LQEPPSPLPDSPEPSRATKIRARSRRQAMDWALVLASQGIGAKIDRDDDGDGWCLLVSAHDGQKAFAAIRQYHVENRGWTWRQTASWPRTFVNWGSLAWAVALALFFWRSNVDGAWQNAGIMDSAAVGSGQWWRIFTAMTLHQNPEHLVSNLLAGTILIGLAMGRFGTGLGLLASFLAGVCGNLVSLLLNAKPFVGLGASGMVMGALGLVAAQSLRRQPGESLKRRLVGVAAGILLFVWYGVSPGSDIPAHLGGFLAGLAFGTLLLLAPSRSLRSRAFNLLAGIVTVLLLAAAWRLALTNGNI